MLNIEKISAIDFGELLSVLHCPKKYIDHKKVRELIPYGTDRDSSSFFYLAETMDGRLVGANKRGIYLINTLSKKLTRVLSGDQVSEVRNIHIDSSDVVWITTYGKGIFLYKLKENKLFKLPVDDKGYLLYSHAFIDDGFNNFLVPIKVFSGSAGIIFCTSAQRRQRPCCTSILM